jgi:hypothetical protein
METGKILHYPEIGGAIEQDDWLLMMMQTAWRVWFVHDYKLIRHMDITDSDTEFTRWFLPEDWRPGNGG